MCLDFETSNIFASGTALACSLFGATHRIPY
jgi:hypothetical protein